MFRLPPILSLLLMGLFFSVWLGGCASSRPAPSLQYSIQPEPLRGGPPRPLAISPADRGSDLIADEIRVRPEALANYHDLPSSMTQIYDTPPRELSLRQVVEETLAHNRQIRIQSYTLRLAEYQIPVSKSIYDLLATATLAYTRTQTQTEAAATTDSFTATTSSARASSGQIGLSQLLPTGAVLSAAYGAVDSADVYAEQASLALTQPLLRGLGWAVTNAPIRIAQWQRVAGAADLQTQIENQLITTLSAYWDLIGAIENYKVQVVSYATALDLLRINQEKFNAELMPLVDVLQAVAAADARHDQIIQAREVIRNDEDALKRLLFLQADRPLWSAQIRPTQPFAWRDVRLGEAETIAQALGRRSELRSLRGRLKQTEIGLRVARNNILPRLDFMGQAFFIGSGASLRAGEPDVEVPLNNYSLGLQFSFPLQNRAARYGARQAASRRAQSAELLQDERDQVTQEVRLALRDVAATRQSIDATSAAVVSQRENLDNARQRFDVGLETTYFILQYQQNLATAQSNHLQAVIDHNKAAIRLERARGTLLETYGIQIDDPELDPARDDDPTPWRRYE